MAPLGDPHRFRGGGHGLRKHGSPMSDGGSGGSALSISLLVAGLGMGLAISPILTVALSTVAAQTRPTRAG